MLCTIVTDASHCSRTKAGAWAAWIVCNGQRFKYARAFVEKCKTPSIAEIQGAINGAFFAKHHFPDATRFHFVADCSDIIRIVEHQFSEFPERNKLGRKRQAWLVKIRSILGEEVIITAKHVKGHNNKDKSARGWVNRWCDKQARRKMKEQRNKLRHEKKLKMIEEIPKGHYCYDENGNCPHWSIRKNKPNQRNGYCSFLKRGDWEVTNPDFPEELQSVSSLLWDQVKECSVNKDDEI